jgi:hypothetical protein
VTVWAVKVWGANSVNKLVVSRIVRTSGEGTLAFGLVCITTKVLQVSTNIMQSVS